MIDPLLTLALTVHSAPRTMALMLGSGLSRSAGIPTGWEVVIDLIRKLAHLHGENCEPDPALWYKTKYGNEPSYASLLGEVATTPAARNALLRGYFEPNSDERAEGLKIPTLAHKAIAKLVNQDFVRIIVTTNFDRLMERALEEEGIVPAVIATSDAIDGILPLSHARCLVIKVHGDYLDSRIRNTTEELATFEPRINTLLDRIFDEYGLIVCGWSADYDTALQAAMLRRTSKQFPWYWTIRSSPSDTARKIITHTEAQVISVSDADIFFPALDEKIQSLVDLAGQSSLSAKVAQATLKRILLDPAQEPRIHDLISTEVTQARKSIISEDLLNPNGGLGKVEILRRLNGIEESVNTLLGLYAIAGHWGVIKPTIWKTGFINLLSLHVNSGGTVCFLALQHYAATLVLYASGLGGITGDNLKLFAQLAKIETSFNSSVETSTGLSKGMTVIGLANIATLHHDATKFLYDSEDRGLHYASDHIAKALREPLREFLPTDELFLRAFDRLEYLIGLLFFDALQDKAYGAPLGNYIHRSRKFDVVQDANYAVETLGTEWPPLKAGLFDGSVERYKVAAKRIKDYLARINY